MISWFTRDEDSQRKCSMQNWQEKSEARDIHISSMLECGYRATSMKGSSKTSTGENCSWILYKRGRKNKLNWAEFESKRQPCFASTVWIQRSFETMSKGNECHRRRVQQQWRIWWVNGTRIQQMQHPLQKNKQIIDGHWNNNTKKITEIVKDKENSYFDKTRACGEIRRRRRRIEDFIGVQWGLSVWWCSMSYGFLGYRSGSI